jgi:eukaryotic-like serine/threonine-protein kinase
MGTDRWQRLNEIFHGALARDPGSRPDYLVQACADDAALRREAEDLLRAHDGAELELGAIERLESALNESPLPGSAGLRLGPYRTSEEIGRGGMGSVWLADRVDGQFEQRVAIKLIKRGMDTAQILRRFEAERRILASFDHPNIARLIDGGTTDDGLPYFVMEHIEGKPIDEYAEERRLPLRMRLGLFLRVCDAVSYAHRRLIIHRDIKPQNILVTADGVPKLLDFGIAKVLHDAEEPGTRTLSVLHLLTPDYASPEQIEGRPTTTGTDVYSLGVVLYELLTGRSPYRPRTWNPRDVCESVLASPVERPSAAIAARPVDESAWRLRGELRGDLDAIVLTAMRKEPERRFASVEQLADDIRRYLDGRPVQARPDSPWYRGGKFVRRNRLAVAAGALLAVTLVGGVIATTWQAREARIQSKLAYEAQARAERRFAEVRKLANALLFEYHDAVMDLPGATAVRARLVGDALDYLNGLAEEAAGDRSLQRELALAYRKVAQVQGGLSDSATLGDTSGAVASQRTSVAILESLLAANPADARARRDLADGLLELANLNSMTQDQAEALAQARRAQQIYESVLPASPLDLELRLALAKAYDTIGTISLESGRADEALATHRRQLQLLESAPAADRNSPVLRRALAVAHVHAADAEGTFGDDASALRSYRRSVQLSAALAEEFPDNDDFPRLMMVGHYWEGTSLQHLGRIREALEAYRRSLAIEEELAGKDPDAHRGTFSLVRVGNMLDRLGEHGEALGYYRRARALLAKDVGADPEDLYKRGGLIEVEAYSCAALARLAQYSSASAACDSAVGLIERTRVEPTNAVIRAALARSYVTMADAFLAVSGEEEPSRDQRLAHAHRAREMYREAVEIWSDMSARDMLTEADDAEAAAVSRSLGNAEAAIRSLAG